MLDLVRGERVVVLSPHLDDAALSLGATIARATAVGSEVTVMTVFAGRPDSADPAGPWDRGCGFASAGEAAMARRGEDQRACAILGASPRWLPFEDEQYARERNERAVWAALAPSFADADIVLVPGYPLAHRDHRWLARCVLRRDVPASVHLYVEQPYASNTAMGESSCLRALAAAGRLVLQGERGTLESIPESVTDGMAADVAWQSHRSTRAERSRKRDSVHAYVSQLPTLGRDIFSRVRLYEWAAGGESIGRVG